MIIRDGLAAFWYRNCWGSGLVVSWDILSLGIIAEQSCCELCSALLTYYLELFNFICSKKVRPADSVLFRSCVLSVLDPASDVGIGLAC